MAEPTTCDECGCKIEFIEGPNGKPIPVQKVRTAYVKNADGRLEKWQVNDPTRPEMFANLFYVSHFETCPNPGRFSRGG